MEFSLLVIVLLERSEDLCERRFRYTHHLRRWGCRYPMAKAADRCWNRFICPRHAFVNDGQLWVHWRVSTVHRVQSALSFFSHSLRMRLISHSSKSSLAKLNQSNRLLRTSRRHLKEQRKCGLFYCGAVLHRTNVWPARLIQSSMRILVAPTFVFQSVLRIRRDRKSSESGKSVLRKERGLPPCSRHVYQWRM